MAQPQKDRAAVEPEPALRALASVTNGEVVAIRHFMFDSLRQLCERAGFGVGDVVRCRLATRTQLLLELPGGHTTSCARDWARFISVATVVPAGGAAVTSA